MRVPTYILNKDTQQLVIRAIGVSLTDTACKDEFRRNLRLTAGVYFHFFIILHVHTSICHYPYARQTRVSWRKETKKIKKIKKIKERKEKKAKRKKTENKRKEKKKTRKARKDKTRRGSKERKREKKKRYTIRSYAYGAATAVA